VKEEIEKRMGERKRKKKEKDRRMGERRRDGIVLHVAPPHLVLEALSPLESYPLQKS
jgi:hypothetical protein